MTFQYRQGGQDLEHRRVGRSGLEVSILGLGCNNFGGRLDKAASLAVIAKALDTGVTLFDTADVYPMGKSGASEEILGEGLKSVRQEIVLTTKFGFPLDGGGRRKGGSRRHVMAALEDSLRRLKTDWIDLYLYHKPDPGTPIEETIRALDDLIRQGKVRYVGCSNFAAWQTVEAHWVARELGANAFICAQEEYSLLDRKVERDVVPVLEAYGLGLIPFFPLASGLLTGKYNAGEAPPADARLAYTKPLADKFLTGRNLELVERYRTFCAERDRELTDLAFAWLLARSPVASVSAGASTPEQVLANQRAVAWSLSPEDLAAVDAIFAAAAPPTH